MVAIFGPERAREHARLLSTQAAHHLESFGTKADLLRHLAAYVVSRRS
jgi:farnesyl diphosphate synthase